MKAIHKLTLIIGFLLFTLSVNAQFRRYYPPRPYWPRENQVGRDGEIQKDSYTHRNSGPTKLHLNLNYGISKPFGSFGDYVDKTSFNGWNIALLYSLNPKWEIGLTTGFYDYYKRIPRKVYHDQGVDISAVQTNTMELIPIQPTVLYFPGKEDSKIKPYVGLGLGVTYIDYNKYWGKFSDRQNDFAFSASPMVGIRIPFSAASPLQFNADVKYNFVSYNKRDFSGLHSLEANVGLSINIR